MQECERHRWICVATRSSARSPRSVLKNQDDQRPECRRAANSLIDYPWHDGPADHKYGFFSEVKKDGATMTLRVQGATPSAPSIRKWSNKTHTEILDMITV